MRCRSPVRSGSNVNCAIKDSFAELDLAAFGFQLLFEATWIWRTPPAPLPKAQDRELQSVRLQDEQV